MKKIIYIILSILFLANTSMAEVITLKSGKMIKGKIIERIGDYIKVDCEGTEIYYENKYIQFIQEDKPAEPQAEAENNLENAEPAINQDFLPGEIKPSNPVPVKVKSPEPKIEDKKPIEKPKHDVKKTTPAKLPVKNVKPSAVEPKEIKPVEPELPDNKPAEEIRPYIKQAKQPDKIAKGSKPLETADSYLKRALGLALKSDFLESEKVLKQGLAVYSSDENIKGALAILNDLKNWDITEEYALYRFQAALYLMDKRYQEAILPLEKLWQIEPRDVEVNYYLGASYLRLEDFQKAASHLFTAWKLDPKAFLRLGRKSLLYYHQQAEGQKESSNKQKII